MGTLCAQLVMQFRTDQLEALQALVSWSVNMYAILALSIIHFLALFLTFELSHYLGLNTIKVHYSGYLRCATSTYPIYNERKLLLFSSTFFF